MAFWEKVFDDNLQYLENVHTAWPGSTFSDVFWRFPYENKCSEVNQVVNSRYITSSNHFTVQKGEAKKKGTY